MKQLVELCLIILWVFGMVIAKGFWSIFFTIIIPPYSIYTVIEWFVLKHDVL